MEMLKTLLSHGLSGYAIVLTAVALVIIAFDRLNYLYLQVVYSVEAEMQIAKKEILSRKYNDAIQVCNRQPLSPELIVVKEGLLALDSGREAMNSALTSAVLRVNRNCENRVSFLSLIASSATLIGLFGTIMGLMVTFQGLGGANPEEKGRLLGLGISEAMNSTAAGVIVGVVAMALHTICVSRTDSIVAKSQDAALQLVKWIEQAERKSD
jgi:biopolymer transport protein ExbB/TolQ